MKTNAVAAILITAVTGTGMARMRTAEWAPKHTITVYVKDDRKDQRAMPAQAKEWASRIFADAGIAVDWRNGRPAEQPKRADLVLIVDLRDETPSEYHPGALAFALPYEGVHLVVFCDRVSRTDAVRPEIMLAHVLAHEITHLLEGISRHSETGVMKAKYTPADAFRMSTHPLPFAPEDVQLMELGIERRLSDMEPPADQSTTATAGEGR